MESRTAGQKEGQTLFHRTFPVMVRGPKRKFTTVQKQYQVDLLRIITLKNFTLILMNCTFKISKIYLKQKVFFYEFTETKKRRK